MTRNRRAACTDFLLSPVQIPTSTTEVRSFSRLHHHSSPYRHLRCHANKFHFLPVRLVVSSHRLRHVQSSPLLPPSSIITACLLCSINQEICSSISLLFLLIFPPKFLGQSLVSWFSVHILHLKRLDIWNEACPPLCPHRLHTERNEPERSGFLLMMRDAVDACDYLL